MGSFPDILKKQKINEKFLGSPTVRTLLSLPRSRVLSLVREGRSQKPHDVTKKKNKKLMDNPLMGSEGGAVYVDLCVHGFLGGWSTVFLTFWSRAQNFQMIKSHCVPKVEGTGMFCLEICSHQF